MKYFFTVFFCTVLFFGFSQNAPLYINYQGVAHSATGAGFVDQPLGLKFRILQGSSATVVFTETQQVTTNPLGLFSTRIGKNSDLGVVDWSSGTYSLEVSMDTLGGSNYLLIGTQLMVSVPYSLYSSYAASAPSPSLSLTNNILTVGSNTISLPPSVSTGTTNINITSSGAANVTTTSANNYNVDVPIVNVSAFSPAPTFTQTGLAQVFGTYPNFTVAVAPVISYNPVVGTLSLSSIPFTTPAYSYAYNITPSLSLNGNVLTVGPSTNSVILPVLGASQASLVSSGAAVTTTLGPNSFSVNVPTTSLTGIGSATVLGAYPNFTISTPPGLTSSPQTSLNGFGAASVTAVGTNSFDLTVPITTISAGSGVTVNGTYPSFTVSASSQSVNVVANPTAGLAQVLGTYPTYTVTVAPLFNYSSSTGSLIITNPGNPLLSYSTNVTPNLNFNPGTGLLSSGPGTNSVTIPVAISPSIAGKGVAVVNPASGNTFTVTVPGTTLTSSNNSATVSATGTNSFDISVPAMLNLNASSGSTVSGSYPNLTITSPQQLNLNTTGGSTLSGTYPNLTIASPQQVSLTATGGASLTGSYPTMTVSAPQQLNLTATGGASVTGTYPNYVVNAPQALNLTATGATTLGGTYPNINIGAPAVNLIGGTTVFSTPVPSGLLQIMGAYPNYSLLVTPNIGYSQSTGSLTLSSYFGTTPAYSYGYNITPNLSATANVIQSGPASNSVAISTPAAQAFAVSGSAITVGTSGTTLFSTSFTKVAAASEIDIFAHLQANTGLISLSGYMIFEIQVDGNTSSVSVPHVLPASQTDYVTLKAVFSGLSTGSHTVSLRARTNTGVALAVTLDPSSYGAKMILKETY